MTTNNDIWLETSTREEWLEVRRMGIGGSDAASVMGLTGYEETYVDSQGETRTTKPYGYIQTPFFTWLEKRGEIVKTFDENRIEIELGTTMEPRILREFEMRTGEKLLPKPSILRHKTYPFIQASLDGWTRDTIVEAKWGRWTPKWGDDGSDVVPLNYWMQGQHYMLATGYRRVVIIALLYSSEGLGFRTYNIFADDEWHEACIERYSAFWDAVTTGTPPALFNLNDLNYRFPVARPLSKIEATEPILDALTDLRRLKIQQSEIEASITERKTDIFQFMEDNEALTYNGTLLATYKNTRRGNRVFNIK
ncbi:MAG: YqaJ viral recombinase family protein [Clostridia bacterium]|nr:YqaJ viral recombinase family protein [Clostridia bacterium]MBQ4143032.1 YqaJ viral recombinase family protein [Thermoguttaceae bacterium]